MLKKYGPTDLAQHYAEFDTICDATQVRSHLLGAFRIILVPCGMCFNRIYFLFTHVYT